MSHKKVLTQITKAEASLLFERGFPVHISFPKHLRCGEFVHSSVEEGRVFFYASIDSKGKVSGNPMVFSVYKAK